MGIVDLDGGIVGVGVVGIELGCSLLLRHLVIENVLWPSGGATHNLSALTLLLHALVEQLLVVELVAELRSRRLVAGVGEVGEQLEVGRGLLLVFTGGGSRYTRTSIHRS